MRNVNILICLLFLGNSLFSQVRTKELYQRSIEMIFKEDMHKLVILFPNDNFENNELSTQGVHFKIADSLFFAKLNYIDTSFQIMKIMPLELVSSYIDVVINDYTFVQKNGTISMIFNNSRHFYFSFNCHSKKYLFTKRFVVNF